MFAWNEWTAVTTFRTIENLKFKQPNKLFQLTSDEYILSLH